MERKIPNSSDVDVELKLGKVRGVVLAIKVPLQG